MTHADPGGDLDTLISVLAEQATPGLRVSEAKALIRSAERRAEKRGPNAQTPLSDGRTKARARWLRIPVRSLALIGELPDEGRAFRAPNRGEYVLLQNGGGQMTEAFDKVCDAAGIDTEATSYVLRRTWATWIYTQAKDFGTLMDLGGWSKADNAN